MKPHWQFGLLGALLLLSDFAHAARQQPVEPPAPVGHRRVVVGACVTVTPTSRSVDVLLVRRSDIYAMLHALGSARLVFMDRISESDTVYEQDGNAAWWRVTTQQVYAADNDATPTTTGVSRQRISGGGSGSTPTVSESVSVDILGNQTVSRTTIDRSAKTVTQSTDLPDSSVDMQSVTVNGLLQSSRTQSGLTTTYTYDDLGRQTGVTDPRTGTATTHFNSLGQMDYTENAAGNRTSFTYDSATGRVISQTDAATNTVRFAYNDRDQVIRKWGSGDHPVEAAYDAYGRMTNMLAFRGGEGWDGETWPANTGTGDATAWTFDEASGLQLAKRDAAGQTVAYTYTVFGKLATRTWARQPGGAPLVTTYSYDPNTAEQIGVDYSENTPDVSYTYNRLGRGASVTDGQGTRAFTYNDQLRLASEAVPQVAGLDQWAWNYDSLGRVAQARLTGGATDLQRLNYGYEQDKGRLASVSAEWPQMQQRVGAGYTYEANADLINGVIVTNGMVPVRREVTYEPNRDRISRVRTLAGETTLRTFEYQRDALGRVTHRADDTTALNDFSYNSRGELTNAVFTTNAFNFVFDPIGNRQRTTANSELTDYIANELNQYTFITNTVNGQPATANFFFDQDGNLTNDGRFAYSWDAENRMIAAESLSAVPDAEKVRCEFAYDYQNRRYRKTVYSGYADGNYSSNRVTTFVWNGWLPVLEMGAGYTNWLCWGLDMSGTLQGAGGVGGLLAINRITSDVSATFVASADAIGNVSDLVDTNGAVVAHYVYDAYGNLLAADGVEAANNFIRYSSKYWDVETGLGYWGIRYMSPLLGRWISNDPLGVQGGLNLYGYVNSAPLDSADPLGLLGEKQSGYPIGFPSQYEAPTPPDVPLSEKIAEGITALMELHPGVFLPLKAEELGTRAGEGEIGVGQALAEGAIYGAFVFAPEAGMFKGLIAKATGGATKALKICAKSSSALESTLQKVETLDFSTPRNGAVFYSGPGQRTRAAAFAERTGGMTIEMTPGGKALASDPVFQSLSPDEQYQVWQKASTPFAQGASGRVNAFIQGARPTGTFRTVEESIIRESSEVYKTTYHY